MYNRIRKGIMILFTAVALTGCSSTGNTDSGQTQQTFAQSEKVYDAAMADSLDQAVLLSKNTKKQQIKLENIQTGRTYTLKYTGATTIQDKNGKELVMEQLQDGSLVTVTFLKEQKAAKALYLREDAAVYQDVRMFEINKAARRMTFGGEQYDLDKNVVVTSEGEKLELMDINDQDALTVSAVDHTVYSIAITKGHGYVRLAGYDFFVGGWVEIGQSVIKPITEGMLLAVPEGTYTMLVSKEGIGGTKEIEVARGEEVEVDVSDLQGEIDESEKGQIIFTITPEGAKLYIDGTETDYSEEVTLGYGVHQIVCRADGYATLSKYIKVSQEYATLDINLEEGGAGSNHISGNPSVSSNSAGVASATSEYSVHIDAPVGAELYLDGNYIGLVPTSFPKVKGTYTVSLRRAGYQTRSYSLQIDDSNKDVNYSFSDLTKQ